MQTTIISPYRQHVQLAQRIGHILLSTTRMLCLRREQHVSSQFERTVRIETWQMLTLIDSIFPITPLRKQNRAVGTESRAAMPVPEAQT